MERKKRYRVLQVFGKTIRIGFVDQRGEDYFLEVMNMKKKLIGKLLLAAMLSSFVLAGCGKDSAGQKVAGDEAQFGEPASYSRAVSGAEESAKSAADSSTNAVSGASEVTDFSKASDTDSKKEASSKASGTDSKKGSSSKSTDEKTDGKSSGGSGTDSSKTSGKSSAESAKTGSETASQSSKGTESSAGSTTSKDGGETKDPQGGTTPSADSQGQKDSKPSDSDKNKGKTESGKDSKDTGLEEGELPIITIDEGDQKDVETSERDTETPAKKPTEKPADTKSGDTKDESIPDNLDDILSSGEEYELPIIFLDENGVGAIELPEI